MRFHRLAPTVLAVFVLIAFALMTAAPSRAAITDGLVAYWSFNSGFQATAGGAGFDATPVNGPVIDADGRFGPAVRFTRAQSQFLHVSTPVITQGQDHTYSAWYRATVFDIAEPDRYFVLESTNATYDDAYSVSYGLRDQGQGDKGQVFTQISDGTGLSVDVPGGAGTGWHNIIITYDASSTGAEHAVYLDGFFVTNMASSNSLKDTAGLIIGGHHEGMGHNWDGWIDDVAFWNRVITADEIAAIQGGCVLGFTDIGAGLTGVVGSSVAWGDYDNDGDLDILLTGQDSGNIPVAKVYANTGGAFSDIGAGLTGVVSSSVAWGDYDNDGDLDILLTGWDSGYNPVAKVYANTGGAFSDIGAGLTGVVNSSVAWGDYDNDGDLDILLTGQDSGDNPVAKVYANTGGAFSDIGAGLPGVGWSSAAWGDYDNDGDLDILLTGQNSGGILVAQVYANSGGAFSDIGAGLPGVWESSVAWGDYDNDGDLDILLTGRTSTSLYTHVARVYANTGGAFSDIGAGLTEVDESSVAWGDYDNDGDLDILLTGWDGPGVAKVYANTGGAFSDIGAGLTGVFLSSAAWGDYDNDGDLDILLTGMDYPDNPVAKVYENLTPTPNTPPTAPGNLTTVWSAGTVTFSWDAATDTETPPAGLSYNLRVGTTPGGSEITAAMAGNASGYRRIPALGNANHNLSWTVDVPASPVYWSVQAIDGAWAGSPFAAEQMAPPFLDIGAGLTGVGYSSAAWGDYDNDGDLDILLTGRDSGDNPVAKVYANAGGAFSDIGAGLTGVSFSSVAWGDYDNDGDLDILLTGADSVGILVAKVYANTGGAFSDIGAGLPGVWESSVAWGDYDNDGDLDILLTGFRPGGLVAKVYANTGGAFSDIGAGLTGVYFSSVAWGDYDNDGDLDILLTGTDSGDNPVAKVYANTGGAFSDIGAGLTGVYFSSVAWGDYDNDGDLDILLTGADSGDNPVAKVYANTDGAFSDIGAGLTGAGASGAAWGDYDNDGDLDVLLTGGVSAGGPVTKVYANAGGAFSDIGAGLTGVGFSSVAWGDYDNDGDLDILLTGQDSGDNPVAKVYENLTPTPNTPPMAPGNLAAACSAGTVTFSWDAATDAETPPAGLSYNLRVGTTPGGSEITAAMAGNASGYRRIPALGNANHNLSWTVDVAASPVYWSVQAIDGAWAGSPFAPEQMAPPFLNIGAGLTGVVDCAAAWGDYDNDGDLDILLAGNDSQYTPVAKVYANTGGVFSDIGAGLTGVWEPSVAWGDYDNDGDLDILLTGEGSGGNLVAKVYANTGGVFSDIGAGLTGVSYPSAAWGDYDNDGDLDVLLTGSSSSGRVAKVYANTGGAFSDIGAGLTGVSGSSSVAWGDYDNDGDLDILLTGAPSSGGPVAKVYANTGGTFSDIGAGLTGVYSCSVAWGDYDNDGDLDILLTGWASGNNPVANVYANTGGTFSDSGAGLTGVHDSSVAWGDYDNDGDLDILLTGWDSGDHAVAKVYANTAGAFSDIGAGLTGVAASGVAWGDYDNDGDLDILLTGWDSGGNPVAGVYENRTPTPNTPPTAPVNLAAAWSAGTVTFSWDAATDAETPPAGLSYNLRVGTTPGGSEITAAMAGNVSGYRRIPALGNANHNLSWTVDVAASPVYWSVQAIDGAWAGSPFAPEQMVAPFLNIGAGLTGVQASSAAWGDYDNDGDLDILLTGWNSGTSTVAKLYANTGGAFGDIGAGLTGVGWSSAAWGDYDNDGDLDILLTGEGSGGNRVAKVYANTGGAFADIGAGLTGVERSSAVWGDYDNDGDLDILLTGYAAGGPVAKVYENTGGAFADIGAGLTGVWYSSVAWGDYDNDGDLDILLTGYAAGGPVAKVYENTGGAFSDIGAGLTGVLGSSVAWGDYDNDGDIDILLTGEDSGGNRVAKVYANTGGAFSDIGAELTGVCYSSVAWGDYDNDGDLDILLTGEAPGSVNWVAKVYANTGGAFADIGAGLTGVYLSSVAWGDCDNDGDLDILLTGYSNEGRVASVYENLTPTPNTPPTAPGNLAAAWSAGKVTFSWDAATDPETPSQGLSYNLRVGTTPGGSEITAAMAGTASGYRRIPALGNANHNLSWTVNVASPLLYWSIQAIDGAWAGSPFATETSQVTGVDGTPVIPVAFALRAAVPNPFRSDTQIQFDLPSTEPLAVLEVFDISGRLVRTLHRAPLPAGTYTLRWDGVDEEGRKAAAGVYLYRLRAGTFETSRRLVLIR